MRSPEHSRFAKYAWFVLGWNILVILWGVFLRASKSGDGCGQHWLTCHGEVVPSAPELKTVIEFTHRVTSAVDGLLVIALLVWAIVIWRRSRSGASAMVVAFATGSFIFVVIEGLLGAGLVLTGNTAETLTPARPFWMAAHLVNTLILLVFLTMTAWTAAYREEFALPADRRHLIIPAVSAFLILLVGISGSIAALTSMIFPVGTLAEELSKDFSPTSHVLLRLRLVHPTLAILTGVFLVFATGWLRANVPSNPAVGRWSNVISLLVLAQLAFGTATLFTQAPIVMQLGHLLLADAIWISFVLLSANLMTKRSTSDDREPFSY